MSSQEFFQITDILRNADVYRWHAVKTLRRQSNSEHMFNVTWIADILSKRIYPQITPEEELSLLRYNLGHDIPEALTGDIASPVKRVLDSYFKGGENPLDDLEAQVCPGYKKLKAQVEGNPLRRISKMADLIEMITFIKNEGVGKYCEKIESNLMIGLKELITSSYEKYPDLDWNQGLNFLEEIETQQGNHIEFEWNAGSLS